MPPRSPRWPVCPRAAWRRAGRPAAAAAAARDRTVGQPHRRRRDAGRSGGAMINVGIIGYGYWGANLVSNFMEVPVCRVPAVADGRAQQLARMNARYPTIQAFGDALEMIASPAVDF